MQIIFFTRMFDNEITVNQITRHCHNTAINGAVKSNAINLKQVSPKALFLVLFFFLAQLCLSPRVARSTSLIANS